MNKLFRFNQLNQSIIIEQPIVLEDKSMTWKEACRLWAHVQPHKIRQVSDFDISEEKVLYIIIIRQNLNLDTNMRILYQKKILKISAIELHNPRARFVTIKALEY